MQSHFLADDLNYILDNTLSIWDSLRGQIIFLTGGTGFFGCWLVESFLWANHTLNLNAHMYILTRNRNRFATQYPHIANSASIKFHEGDIRSFTFPKENISYVIHGAGTPMSTIDQQEQLSTLTQGTLRILQFAVQCKAKQLLLISSGAIYGKQPTNIARFSEDYQPIPLENDSAYVTGKRHAEQLAKYFAEKYALDIKIARCFAFIGPYLSIDARFAITQFIKATLTNQPIDINHANTYRSYMYAADLVIWLWTILMQGQCMRPYNVGSDEALNMLELANLITYTLAQTTPPIIRIADNSIESRYIPNIQRAQTELNLKQGIDLMRALKKTKRWYDYQKFLKGLIPPHKFTQ